MTPQRRLLMWANRATRRLVFTRRAAVRVVFGVETVAPLRHSYFEWGTVLQRKLVRRYVRPGHRVLDLGTGPHALVAIYVKKHVAGVSVVASDILPARVEWARRTAARNGADVTCVEADMFDGVEGRFDTILCFPPCVPSGDLVELGASPELHPRLGLRRVWRADGGPDGLDLIRRLAGGLNDRLAEGGKAVMCVNPVHVRPARILAVSRAAGVRVVRIERLLGIMNAYILERHGNRRSESPGAARALS